MGRTGSVVLLGAILAVIVAPARAQDCGDLYDPFQVLDFYVTMSLSDWEALRLSCPGGYCGERPHDYFPAQFRCEDGPIIDVGIRRKNGLAEPSEDNPQKPPLKIDINEFIPEQTYMGKLKLSLENGQSDVLISEGLAWLFYRQAGIVAGRAAWANVYVNGDYKGLYVNVEQIDKAYLTDNGIDEGGFLFKVEDQRTREGESSPFAFNWYPFDHPHAPPEEATPADWHDQAASLVDIRQLLTLGAVENFVANTDAAFDKGTNYWYYDWAVFPQGRQPRLYLGWDLDTTMQRKQTDRPILGEGPGHLRLGLVVEDEAFQAQYLTIYDELIRDPLALSQTLALVNDLEPVLTPHVDADPHQTMGGAGGEFERLRGYLEARTAFVRAELGACPDATCQPAENPCTCPADCGSSPSNETDCTNGVDEDCDRAVDCADADCDEHPDCASTPTPNRVVINEILATSPGSPDVEFIEIHNEGPGAQDLTGWYVIDDNDAHDKCYLEGTLAAGDYLVVAGRIVLFTAAYPEVGGLNPNPFDGDSDGQGFALGDGGDQARLFKTSALGDVAVHGITFGVQGDDVAFGYYPERADAPEYLEFPTPGTSNDVTRPYSPICINEFLTTSQTGGVDDWIELYNRASTTVDIGGWHLSDDLSQPTKYTFPAGTSISPGDFLIVDEYDLGFALSSTGSELIMLTHADGITGQDYFDFGPQFPDVTRGRYPDGSPYWHFMNVPSPGLPNVCAETAPPPVNGLTFSSPDEFSWDAIVGGGTYDVVEGSLGTLRTTLGGFATSVTGCLGSNQIETTMWDESLPNPGSAFFYLVRASGGSCADGTWDSGFDSQDVSRDFGVESSPSTCP